jgi:2-isopropylmalate synthase
MLDVTIYDTTLRDGAQGEGISFSLDDKMKIARKLDYLGISYIEGGWPGSNPKELEFFQAMRDYQWQHAQLTAFSSTRKAGVNVRQDSNVKALLESGVQVATILAGLGFSCLESVGNDFGRKFVHGQGYIVYLKECGLQVFFDAEHFF